MSSEKRGQAVRICMRLVNRYTLTVELEIVLLNPKISTTAVAEPPLLI
jgi:hypothetical protein